MGWQIIVIALLSCVLLGEISMALEDVGFQPRCVDWSLSSKEIRPGGQISVTFYFKNEGTAPASTDYFVFVHLEHPDRSCANIVVHGDHEPLVPTTCWLPGKTVMDGPYLFTIPESASEGTYHIHVGVYSFREPGYPRLSDQYVGEIQVRKDAPEVKSVPPSMSSSEVAKRRLRLSSRVEKPIVLEDEHLRFSISRKNGSWALLDKATGEVWCSSPEYDGIGMVKLTNGCKYVRQFLQAFSDVVLSGKKVSLRYPVDTPDGTLLVNIYVELLPLQKGLRFSYDEEQGSAGWRVEEVRLLDNGLWATEQEKGYFAIPNRLGILFPASEGLPCTDRYTAYSNYRSYSMAMFGAVKNGSAVLVHWEDPYTVLEVRRAWVDLPLVPGHSMISASLIMRKTAKWFVVNTLGRGGYVEIAKAYRDVARERGLLRTWKEKIAVNPNVERMLGAADFKPFVFVRLAPNTRYNQTPNEKIYVGYTFDEAASVAEHLRKDVGIDRAMYVLAGWIRRGYDNQHPDILPPAPECGGSEGLADCAKRVKAVGYMFGLHDNYQDMYKDAPSWDESYIMKRPDGSLYQGGEWAGGLAYLTCSRKALEIASRDQNIPSVKRLYNPDIYFIDTTFAAPPYECFDPAHPLSLNDDIYWKRKLSEYARATFGLFGSEEGQEWAVPCADYFEGMMSHKTQRRNDEIVVPLFLMVYGDCVNLYTHQGDRAVPDRPSYILDHILCAEMPIYDFGSHLYYKQENNPRYAPVKPSIHSIKQIGPREFEIIYKWEVKGIPANDYVCFVHFVDPASGKPEGIMFQNDHFFEKVTSSWKDGDVIFDGPYTVHVPEKVTGEFQIMIGLMDSGGRVDMLGTCVGGSRYYIGTLSVSDDEIKLLSPSELVVDRFFLARQDNSPLSNTIDRFIKNTYEVLSPLNRITAHTPMTDHKFLTSDRKVEQAKFGDVNIVVNYGEKPYNAKNTVLPRWGFLVESPTFIAFHALKYRGKVFSEPTMLVVYSLDGKPLDISSNIHIYHAFGDKSAIDLVAKR
jgi:hypothetical protein